MGFSLLLSGCGLISRLATGGPGIGAGMGALVMPNFGRGLNRAVQGSSKLSNASSASSNAVANASNQGSLQAAASVALDEQGFTQAALAAAGEGTLDLGTLPGGGEAQDTFQPRTRGMGSMTAWQALADQVRPACFLDNQFSCWTVGPHLQ
jgi:hypothetical protein